MPLSLVQGLEAKVFPWDVVVWLVGVIFIGVFLLGVVYIGDVRRWDADSGWTHNTSETSAVRFLSEPYVEEPGVRGRYGTDAGARWYYWKLKPNEVNVLTRVVPWLCYVLHQLFMWGCIYYAQKLKLIYPQPGEPKYSSRLRNFNWIAFIGNVLFHLIHLGQTHWTYDALAQDVSGPSNIGSAIMLLIFVLMLEYRNRGMAFGWPSKDDQGKISEKMRLPWGPQELIRRYHGYVFAWGAIFTFWHHPMENTIGHVMGFTHTWMFLLQGSLMYTQFHLNRYWRLLLEAWVIIHGTVVAWQTGGPALNRSTLYPMFMFGFLWLFTMTQLFGLPLWTKVPKWTRAFPFVAYLAAGIYCYGWVFADRQGRYWIRLNEMVRIPAIEYFCVLFAWLVMWFFLWIEKKIKGDRADESFRPPSPVKEALYICGVVFTYAILMVVSVLVQLLDWKAGIITLMMFFMLFFAVGVAVSCMLLKQILRPVSVVEKEPLEDKIHLSMKVAPEADNKAYCPDNATEAQVATS
ncbi:uncharacterized protein [Diadema antillarum]|uniref:uncharacterized protein n=1 Tax=Diadema antillarum TaxID=105358 RepID=UPI003A84A9D0